MFVIVLEKFLADVRDVQRVMIAGGETIKRASLACKLRLLDLNLPTRFVRQVATKLRIDCVHFSLSGALGKQWLLEKLAEDVESFVEHFILDIEMIVRIILTRRCIFASTMRLNKLRIVVLLREFSRAKEKHVFTEVSEAIVALWVI